MHIALNGNTPNSKWLRLEVVSWLFNKNVMFYSLVLACQTPFNLGGLTVTPVSPCPRSLLVHTTHPVLCLAVPSVIQSQTLCHSVWPHRIRRALWADDLSVTLLSAPILPIWQTNRDHTTRYYIPLLILTGGNLIFAGSMSDIGLIVTGLSSCGKKTLCWVCLARGNSNLSQPPFVL